MIDIQGPGSVKKMSGLCQGYVHRISDLLFARKHFTNEKEEKKAKNIKHLFSFVSSPLVYKTGLIINTSKGWCHGFRNPQKFLPKTPNILLPESDFVDKKFVYFKNRRLNFKYDFFYFTLNCQAGV